MNSIEEGEDKAGSGRPVGMSLTVNSGQKDYLINFIDQKPNIVLDVMMEKLTNHLYKYVTTNCNTSLKRAQFRPTECNSDTKVETTFKWVAKLLETDIDYMTICIFIDDSGFSNDLKGSMVWASVDEAPIVEVPNTRATSHTIIGAISPLGVVNVQLKILKVVVASNSKKRKGPGGAIKKPEKGKVKGGIVTGQKIVCV